MGESYCTEGLASQGPFKSLLAPLYPWYVLFSATELEVEGYFCIHTVWLCVCTGKPNPDPDHPDYVPSINMNGKRKEGTKPTKLIDTRG